MRKSLRSILVVLLVLVALVAGCGGSTGSASPGPVGGTVDAQLRDDANWQVIRTADQ